MHDYRGERYYVVFLLYYLVSNLQKNSRKNNVLTKSKLIAIFHLVNNPALLKKAFEYFGFGNLKSYQSDLYERSLLPFDFQDDGGVTSALVYLCHIKRIKINDDGTIEVVGAETNFLVDVDVRFLDDNLLNLKKIVTKSETQLTKLAMG